MRGEGDEVGGGRREGDSKKVRERGRKGKRERDGGRGGGSGTNRVREESDL